MRIYRLVDVNGYNIQSTYDTSKHRKTTVIADSGCAVKRVQFQFFYTTVRAIRVLYKTDGIQTRRKRQTAVHQPQ